MRTSHLLSAALALCAAAPSFALAGDVFEERFEAAVPGGPPGQFTRLTGLTPGVSEVVTVNAAANAAGTGNALRISDGNQNEVMARTETLAAPSAFSLRFRYHGNATSDRAMYVMLVAESVSTPSPDSGLLVLELFQSATDPLPGQPVNASALSVNDGGTWRRASPGLMRSTAHEVEAFVNQHDTAALSYVRQGVMRTLSTNRFDVWVDGALYHGTPSGGWSLNPANGFTGDSSPLRLALLTPGPFSGTDFTLDDFSITTVPEPACLPALLLLAASLQTRRPRRPLAPPVNQ